MREDKLLAPTTMHSNGMEESARTGLIQANGINLLEPNKNNRFKKKIEDEYKTDTEILLEGISQFDLTNLTYYYLFQPNYELNSREIEYELEMYLNQIDAKDMKDSKMRDKVQWCKKAIEARKQGIMEGPAFINYVDEADLVDGYFDDLVKNVKIELPIEEYLADKIFNNQDKMEEYLSKSSFNLMVHKLSTNKFIFDQCEAQEALRVLNTRLKSGDLGKEVYFEMFERIQKQVEKFKRINGYKVVESALDKGFTANVSEEECVAEFRKNMDQQRHGNNKFKFGHRWLNLVTGGGLESKQIMVYGAPSGNGKTSMMISSCIDMALYNPDCKHLPGLKPCIFYISAETGLNDIRGRYIKMLTGEDVSWDDTETGETQYLPEEEICKLMVKANKILAERTPVSIKFIQVPNNIYQKEAIREDMERLKDQGYHVVAVVADYIKGFKPVEAQSENRLKIENIVADLRALAIEEDVAVITASQVKVDISDAISDNRSNCKTNVIPMNCPDTVFSESKGINDICDFGILFAQTSDRYERNPVTQALIYTHLEALVVKTRAGGHNNARAFIPYVEGTRIAFKKDYGVTDSNGKPVWFSSPTLEFKGDMNKIKALADELKGDGKMFKNGGKGSKTSAECNITPEADVMDTLPTGFSNPALNDMVAA